MKGWQERVIIEKEELDIKLEKLTRFLDIIYQHLPVALSQEEAIDLLQRQQNVMVDYSDLLRDRILLFTKQE